MIRYEWRTALSGPEADELADLLSRAARYDAEPEYSTIDFSDVADSLGDPAAHHLLIWMLPHATALSGPDSPERIAGLVRLIRGAAGTAEATGVIDPDLRSIGISTLLLERVGLDTGAGGGWLGTGARVITAWARGNHPAAGRLSDRFLIPRTRRMWKLIRVDGPNADTAAGPAHPDLTAPVLFADSADTALVHAARLAGFQHDRTDVRYQLGGA